MRFKQQVIIAAAIFSLIYALYKHGHDFHSDIQYWEKDPNNCITEGDFRQDDTFQIKNTTGYFVPSVTREYSQGAHVASMEAFIITSLCNLIATGVSCYRAAHPTSALEERQEPLPTLGG